MRSPFLVSVIVSFLAVLNWIWWEWRCYRICKAEKESYKLWRFSVVFLIVFIVVYIVLLKWWML